LEHGREERQDVDLEGHFEGSSPSAGLGESAAPASAGRIAPDAALPWREKRCRRRGRRGSCSTAGAARSRTASSMTISPRSGAKSRMTVRTAGRSNSPAGPPRTM
ncbi:MAG TPA: hypothetical protein VGQ85_06915, partial [Candidatus Limnocylindrales bacterium]|nr:hypothetical protein [Candidatus Limnocylindrales bacterium]